MSTSAPDFKALSRNDQVFLGAGFASFIFSFIAFAHIHVADFGGNTISAWHGIGVFAGLLILAAVIVGAINNFAPDAMKAMPISGRLLGTGLAALALVFFVIRWLTLPSANGFGIHIGYSLYWGGYVLLVLNIVTVAFGFLGMKDAGESIPGIGGGSAPTPPAA